MIACNFADMFETTALSSITDVNIAGLHHNVRVNAQYQTNKYWKYLQKKRELLRWH